MSLPRPWVWVLIGALSLAILFAGLGRIPFIDRDEGEYAAAAQGMIDRSDWVIPHVNGRPYYEKPALFFWLMGLAFKAFGQGETAGRLPSALSGLALVLILYWFGKRRGDERLGLLCALFTLTSFLIVLLARAALLDMPLTLWTTLTLILFYEGYHAPSGRDRWYFRGAWASMGLAFLTKGPVGAAVPLLAVFPLVLADRTLFSTLRRVELHIGLAFFLLAAGPWYALALMREGRAFWEGFFISQNVTRYTEALLGHGAPLWFYLPVLAFMVWPWSFFALPVIWRGLAKSPRPQRLAGGPAALDFFLVCWLGSGFIFFSLSATKQPNYILPAVPPLVILAARWWQDLLAGRADRPVRPRLWLTVTGLAGLVLAGFYAGLGRLLPAAVKQARERINPDSFEYAFPPGPLDIRTETAVVGLLLAAAAAAALAAGLSRRHRATLTALTAAGVFFIGGTWHLTFPKTLDYLQTPARKLALGVRQIMRPGDSLAAFGLYKPTLWFYTGHYIKRIRSDEVERLERSLAAKGHVYLLSRLSLLPVLAENKNFRLLQVRGGYVLGDNKARPPDPASGSR